MKRVLVLTNHLDDDPCYRLRVKALIAPLRDRGIELTVCVRPKGFLARRRLAASASQFDAVIVHRKMLDAGEYRILRARSPRILYDVDDAVWQLATRQSWLTRLRLRRRFLATVRHVDHIAAGNDFLAAAFAPYHTSISIVPTVVEPTDYLVKSHAPTDSPRLVWIGTSPNLPYVQEILPAIVEARRTLPGLRLLLICDKPFDNSPVPLDFRPWSLAAESADLNLGDIGIAPTPNNPWTLGKCGFKIVQYMAAGLPVIASPVGANAAIVRPHAPDSTGFLPTSHAAWVQAILALAQDPDLRARLGQAGRRRVEDRYSVAGIAQHWAALLHEHPEGKPA